MNQLLKEVSVVAGAIIGLAILAVLVSKQGNGVQVIQAAGNAFTGAIKAATNPFGGGGYGASSFGSFGTGLTAN